MKSKHGYMADILVVTAQMKNKLDQDIIDKIIGMISTLLTHLGDIKQE